MNEPEVVVSKALRDVLLDIIEKQARGVMTHLRSGKWHICEILFKAITPNAVQVEVQSNERRIPIDIQINQPVGISVPHEFTNYVFESVVIGTESVLHGTCSGRVLLEMPEKLECMHRRAYSRVCAPGKFKIQVLFWHRGYLHDAGEAPLDNYWQGRMIDLSAGGMQISIDCQQGENFRAGQLVGMQFTPLPHQKPVLVEAQVKHLATNAEPDRLQIGVEFIGLEASSEGRQELRRLIEIVHEYDKLNAGGSDPSHGSSAVSVL